MVLKVIYSGKGEFKVIDGSNMLVNLNKWTCNFYNRKVSGLPCKHVFACILDRRYKTEDYIHQEFTKESYMKTYSGMIHPIPSEESWNANETNQHLLPTINYKPKSEKSSKERTREPIEPAKYIR